MRRYGSQGPSYSSFSFGPGPLSPALKALIGLNVALFLAAFLLPELIDIFGLRPSDAVLRGRVWQILTYMFLHGSVGHLLFNMLALWMFGTELERIWGTRAFMRYYLIVGAAAAVSTILVSSTLPFAARTFNTTTIGASGAIYGLLLAYGLLFPNRSIMLYFVFPIPAKYFVMILGAIALLMSVSDSGGGVAHITHLGGLVAGYLLLRGRRFSPANEVRYRYLRWKMERARRKFGVYAGGRKDDWDKRVH
jgi:membrane associated rhomboid family serine protease